MPFSHNRLQQNHYKVESNQSSIERERIDFLGSLGSILPMICMLGWPDFRPFAALMILIRFLHQFLLSADPLPEKSVRMKTLYVLKAYQTKENFAIPRKYLTLKLAHHFHH